jgi:hypothetical protein
MLYRNTSDKPKLASVKRMKQWVQPGATVDLDNNDVRLIGANGVFFSIVTSKDPAKEERRARRARSRARKVERLAKRAAATKKKKSGGALKRAVKKVTRKLKSLPTKQELSAQRKQLKDKLDNEMNKGAVIYFAEEVLGIDVKSGHTKDKIVKAVLSAAKDYGYKKALKKT